MKGLKTTLTFTLLLFGFINSAYSSLTFNDATHPELITSGRAQAMGSAYIAKTDDAASAFYNPAGLGTVRNASFRLSNFILEANKNWTNHTTGGSSSDLAENLMNGFELNDIRKALLENKDEVSYRRFQFMPNLTTRYFTMGALYSTQAKGFIGQEAGAKFEYAERTDYGPYAGLNLSLWGGVIKIGITGVYLFREEISGEADQDAELDLPSSSYNKGHGVFATSGIKITLPYKYLPTLAATSHNSFNTEWQTDEGDTAPDELKNSIDVGVSITPQIGKIMRLHMEVNYKDITKEHDDFKNERRILAGMELDIARSIFFRVGYGDGYASGGFGVKARRFEIDFSTYSVELSDDNFREKEDRRYVLGFSAGL